jgi:hypothetical protein
VRTVTSSPRAERAAVKARPRNPDPPVMTARINPRPSYHQFTSSPHHEFTSSPVHQLTNSPASRYLLILTSPLKVWKFRSTPEPPGRSADIRRRLRPIERSVSGMSESNDPLKLSKLTDPLALSAT